MCAGGGSPKNREPWQSNAGAVPGEVRLQTLTSFGPLEEDMDPGEAKVPLGGCFSQCWADGAPELCL